LQDERILFEPEKSNEMRIVKLLLFISLFAPAAAFNAYSQTNAGPKAISYRIRPVPRADRTNLEISVRFKAENSNRLTVKLPTDNFGTPDLYKSVTSFAGEEGTVVEEGEKAGEKVVSPAADGSVALSYTISYDPQAMDAYAYGPNTGAGYFHVAGCQWLLHVGDDAEKRRFRIEIVDAPKSWKLYSSKSTSAAKFEVDAAYDDFIAAPLGGGENVHVFNVRGGRVSVFVHGEYEIPRGRIYAAIEKIVRLQRQWFDDYAQPDFTIVVAPRGWVVSGYAPENSFVCFVKKDITPEQLHRIVAHELFHHWLPNRIKIVQDKKYSEIRYEWLTEGFTDYFARLILTEAGLMSRRQFAASINRDLLNISDNPHRAKTYAELAALIKANQYGPAAKKLAYYRGALIALEWDARLRQNSRKRDLSDFVRELYQTARKTNGTISEADFFDFAARLGIDARADLEKYVTNGEPIVPSSGALGAAYRLIETSVPAFEIGFSLDEAYRTRKIGGVKRQSAAEKAGLRDGMEFVAAENSSRFSNAWSPEKPLVVRVRVDGRERRIEYFPHGELVKVRQFVPVKTD
jgi:predicted metalloprotease with PDZ domain